MNCYNPFSLTDKKILVTGASSGIGRAIAIECSLLGATLILTGRDNDRLHETLSMLDREGHIAIAGDLSNQEDLENLVNNAGKVDGIVACAGISGLVAIPFANRKKFDKFFDINFFSTTELFRLFVKKKYINKNGSLVAIASIGGIRDFTNGKAIYGSSKAALSAFMKYLAKDVSPKRIRVNTICPGMINTPLSDKVSYTEDEVQRDLESYPLGRYGEPEEVAYAAVYLLSDASKWVTGTDLVIDGGHTI